MVNWFAVFCSFISCGSLPLLIFLFRFTRKYLRHSSVANCLRVMNTTTSKPASHSLNQPARQQARQSLSQPVSQPTSQSARHTASQPVNQPDTQSASHSTNQSISLPVSHLSSQPAIQSTSEPDTQSARQLNSQLAR